MKTTITSKDTKKTAVVDTNAKLALIAAIYEGYYNTNQATVDFAEEFFFTVGRILNEGAKKENLNLKHLLIDEIEVPENICKAKDKRKDENTIIITLKSLITPEAHEKLEDALSEFLHEQGLSGTIDNTATENTTTIKRRR